MAVVVMYTFPKDGIEVYDRHLAQRHDELADQPARRSHVCFETGDGYTVVDVWDSAEDFEAFGDVLGRVNVESRPADGDAKAPPVHITIHRVHNAIP